MANAELIRALPKVEIHLHLEGAIPIPGAVGAGREVRRNRRRSCRRWRHSKTSLRYRDFPHFLRKRGCGKTAYIREYDDFAFIAAAVADDLAHQNVRYVEAFHSPGRFQRVARPRGRSHYRIGPARSRRAQRSPSRSQLIADLTRDFGPDRGACVARGHRRRPTSMHIIGIGIGGSEHEHSRPSRIEAGVRPGTRGSGFAHDRARR